MSTPDQGRPKKPWPSYVASFMINEMAGACRKRGITVQDCGVSPYDLSYLLQLNYDGHIDRKTARESLDFMLDRASNVREFIECVSNYPYATTRRALSMDGFGSWPATKKGKI